MISAPLGRRAFLRTLALGTGALAAAPLWADETAGLHEPVHRVAKAESPAPMGAAEHPLDPGLKMAGEALVRIRTIKDYTATMVKRERIKGELGEYEFMFAKIRNRKMEGDKLEIPLSVYLNFTKPDSVKGREVIWVEGQNNNKLRAHEGGFLGGKLPSVWLDPDGALAMRGNLHPIYDIGIENLVLKLIAKGEAVRQLGPQNCEISFTKDAKIKASKDDPGRVCTVLNVRHPQQLPAYEFHLAQIFIDDEHQVPIRYAAYHWPVDPGDTTGPVLEEYTYLNLKLNVGLEDADFDPNNQKYNF
jgi:hypothetical protein